MADQAEFTFESKEWQKILNRLNRKFEDIKKRKEFGGIISSVVFQDIMDHFDKEQGPDGKWQDWSSSYAKHMAKIGRSGNKILQFDGNLRQKFTPQSWRAKPDGILFFNNAKTKAKTVDDNKSNIDLQKMKRAESKKNIRKGLKKYVGGKAAEFISKRAAKVMVKVEKKKSTKKGGGFPYAKAHDEGSKNLPQRRFMWLSNKAIDSIVRQTLKWMKED